MLHSGAAGIERRRRWLATLKARHSVYEPNLSSVFAVTEGVMATDGRAVGALSRRRRGDSLIPFDPTDAVFLADPYPVFAALRARGPVHPHPLLGIPVAVTHAACTQLLRGRDLGRIWADAQPAEEFAAFNLLHRNSLLEREGPAHARLRSLVAGAFNRGHTARLEPSVRALAGRLVGELADRIRADGSADLIAGVAATLPVEVIAELLAVPEPARSALRGWSNTIVTMYEPAGPEPDGPEPDGPEPDGPEPERHRRRAAAERAAAEFVEALRELIAHRRRRPGDDLISDLLAADVDADELVGTAGLLLMAGHEATVNAISNGMLALLRHPDQWRRLLADPGLDARCVEELLRFDPPLQLFERTAIVDTEVAGHPVAAGTKIAALLGAAARDPHVFAEPDALDVGRARNPHLGFGIGVHYCLGAPLARLEVAATLAALRTTLPRLAIAAEPLRRPDFVMRGLRELHLSIDPR
jgi:cytochrome P450